VAAQVRVVAVRRGRIRAAEFALRPGEEGLSMFICADDEQVRLVVGAVRSAGKIGPLAAASLTERDLDGLGLVLVRTAGGTPDDRANALHVEARLSDQAVELARRLGLQPWEYFNQQLAGALHARARVIFEEPAP
jgi:hypothetical protein